MNKKNFELDDNKLEAVNGGFGIGGSGEGYTWKLVGLSRVDVTITGEETTAVSVLESIKTRFKMDEASEGKMNKAAQEMDAAGVKICHIYLSKLNIFTKEVTIDRIELDKKIQ